MPRVMISYRNTPEQSQFALDLNDALKSSGIETWIDVEQLTGGGIWKDNIVKGIKNSDCVIVCLSPEYFESDICLMECYIARGYDKRIIPLVVSENEDSDIFQLIMSHEETKSIEDLTIGRIQYGSLFGIDMSREDFIQRTIEAVNTPYLDMDFDVYTSYKTRHAPFATSLADSLNDHGISTFIATRHRRLGADWRADSWNAILQARYHLVVLTPGLTDSTYIKNELRIAQTKPTTFIPVLAPDAVDNYQAINDIRETFTAREFSMLTDIQWFMPDDNLVTSIIDFIQSAS